jgi:ketosteroid isomerase-like protein
MEILSAMASIVNRAKHRVLLATVALHLAACAPRASSIGPAAPPGRGGASSSATALLPADAALRDELIRREIEMKDDLLRLDAAALDSIVAMEFQLSRPSGPAAPRNMWLENLKKMTLDGYDLSAFQVNVWGNVAIVHAHHTIKNWKTGDRLHPTDFEVTDLWVKRDGRWQIIHRASEPQNPPPPPAAK